MLKTYEPQKPAPALYNKAKNTFSCASGWRTKLSDISKLKKPASKAGFLLKTLCLAMKTCRAFIYEGLDFFKQLFFINIYEVQVTIVVSPRKHLSLLFEAIGVKPLNSAKLEL